MPGLALYESEDQSDTFDAQLSGDEMSGGIDEPLTDDSDENIIDVITVSYNWLTSCT